MGLNEIGTIAWEKWNETAKLRTNVNLDAFIVMPNHVHGLIQINNPTVETHCNASLHNSDFLHQDCNASLLNANTFGPQFNNLASIVRDFKASVKRECNKSGFLFFAWQSSYYDHIIRSKESIEKIRGYIEFNPKYWYRDRNNPNNL